MSKIDIYSINILTGNLLKFSMKISIHDNNLLYGIQNTWLMN